MDSSSRQSTNVMYDGDSGKDVKGNTEYEASPKQFDQAEASIGQEMIVKQENLPDDEVQDDKTVTLNTHEKDEVPVEEFLEIG